MAAIESASSWGPQPTRQGPPIAQAPNPTVVISGPSRPSLRFVVIATGPGEGSKISVGSGQNIVDDLAVNVGEAEITPNIEIDPTRGGDAHEVKFRGVQVVDMDPPVCRRSA